MDVSEGKDEEDGAVYKMKFMMTKIVYGTWLVSVYIKLEREDGHVRIMNRQLKSHSFVFMRGFLLPPTMYCEYVSESPSFLDL